MSSPKRIALILGIALFLTGGRAFADDTQPLPSPPNVGSTNQPLPSPHVRMTNDGELTTNGKRYFLPLGTHILDGTSFENLEKEVRRLQTQEVRLTAENKSLRDDSGGPGWGTVLVVAMGAVALGFTVNHFAQ